MTISDGPLLRRAGLLLFAALLAACVPAGAAKTASDSAASDEDIEDPATLPYGGIYDDPELAAYVDGIARRVAGGSAFTRGRTLRTAVLDSELVNAIVLPDGQIFVTRGLLALASDEAELAGVLAHEIAHVQADHWVRMAARSNVTRIYGAPVPGGNRVEAGQRIEASVMGYNREQELEADRLGFEALTRAGYDPTGMIDFLGAMDRDAELNARLLGMPADGFEPDYARSHPPAADRILQARTLAAGAAAGGDRDRNRYLEAIEGMRWGEGEGEPLIRRSSVIDLEAGLRWEAPRGYLLFRTPVEIVAYADSVTTLSHDRIAQRPLPAMDYLTRIWGRRTGMELTDVEPITVGGFPGAAGVARVETLAGDLDFRLIAVETGPDRIDRFILRTRPEETAARTPEMLRAVESLRALASGERESFHPRRIEIVTVGSGDTIERLAARMAVDEAPVERFLVLNGLEPGAPLPRGSLVKLIVE